MAITFDGPLTESDVARLRERYADSYVQYQIGLYGLADGEEKGPEEPEEPVSQPGDPSGAPADPDASNGGEKDGEDLIGDGEAYDVLAHTEAEVKTWSETASDEDKAVALAAEQAREDRDPRKGVVTLLS